MIGEFAEELLLEAFPGQFDYYFRKIMYGPIFDSAILIWWAKWRRDFKANQEAGFTDQKIEGGNEKSPQKITLVRNGKLICIFIPYDNFLKLFPVATNIYIEGAPEDALFLRQSILESFKETGLEKINERIMLRLRNEHGEPHPIKRPTKR